MQTEITCPACQKSNKDTKLALKQINFDLAVYLCPIKRCKYPKGYPWLIKRRSFEEFTKLISQSKQEEHDKATQNTNTKKKGKKSKFMENILKVETPYSETFNRILDELANIPVDANDQKDNVVNEKQPEVIKSILIEDNDLFGISLPNLSVSKRDNLVENLNTASFSDESFVNGMFNCDDYLSTSVPDVVADFIASGEMNNAVDFNIDDFLLDDAILGTNTQ